MIDSQHVFEKTVLDQFLKYVHRWRKLLYIKQMKKTPGVKIIGLYFTIDVSLL